MAYGLLTYSDANRLEQARDLSVSIRKVENGYIFHLSGSRENPNPPKSKNEFYDHWISISTDFVYQDLAAGLKEVEEFFKMIEKTLDKKTKKCASKPVKK